MKHETTLMVAQKFGSQSIKLLGKQYAMVKDMGGLWLVADHV